MKEPKKKIEIVYYLIQRMSRTEKRHFKLYNQIYKGKNKGFIKLFDFLNNLKTYDAVVVEAFLAKKIVKQKNVCIAYLLNKVTETIYLIGNHELMTIKKLIQPHLNTFHVYFRVRLFELAYKELDKAEEIADKYEEIIMLFRIYELKRHVAELTSHNQEICESDTIIRKKRTETLQKLNHQENIVRMSGGIYTGGIKLEEAYKKLVAYETFYDEFTVLDKINFNICYFLYYSKQRERRKALISLINCIELFDNNPHFISNEVNPYISIWHNIIVWGVHPDCIDLGLEYYEKYKKLPQKHKEIFDKLPIHVEISYYITGHVFDIKYIISFEKYHEVERVTQEIKTTLERYSNSILRRDHFHIMLLRVSYGNLLIGNYTESEYWLAQVLKSPHPISSDILDEAEILTLVFIREENNESLLLSGIRSLDRKWKTDPPTSSNVLHIIELLKQTLLKRNQDKLPQVFKTAHENALQIEDANQYYLPFSKWIALKM